MTNLKEELNNHIDTKSVKCIYLKYDKFFGCEDELVEEYYLKIGYTDEDKKEFLSKLDFEYDDGYGSQELFGTIWYEDGSWSERGEYDGAEWWEHKLCPPISEELY